MILLLALFSCIPESPEAPFPVFVPDTDVDEVEAPLVGGNVLLILSDDIGTELTGVYESQDVFPTYTPNIDAMADEGVLFRNAFVAPTCSPTRASLLTGRHPTRHGIGRWIHFYNETWDLQLDELTLPEMLSTADYTSAAIGKWHVVTSQREDAPVHPLQQGFHTHRGTLGNHRDAFEFSGFTPGYSQYEKNVDGDLSLETHYLTTDSVDDALEQMNTLPEPWFVYLALNAAHEPWTAPPDHLNPSGITDDSPRRERFDAVISAADTELGRLMGSLTPQQRAETTIIYIADNGTPKHVVRSPYDSDRVKGSVFDGGVRVPMIVMGPYVEQPGTETDALVSVVDFFPTLAEIAGVDVETLVGTEGGAMGQDLRLDGQSFLPLLADPRAEWPRDVAFSETFTPNGPDQWNKRTRVVRSHTHKLIVTEQAGNEPVEAFFRNDGGEYDEGEDLIDTALSSDDAAELAALRAAYATLDADLSYGW